jgi:hypothetical protein
MTTSSTPHAPRAASANSKSAYWASNRHLRSDRRLRTTSITVTDTKTAVREARIAAVTGWPSQNLLAEKSEETNTAINATAPKAAIVGRRGAFGGSLPPRSPLLLFKDLPNHADDNVSPVKPIGWE